MIPSPTNNNTSNNNNNKHCMIFGAGWNPPSLLPPITIHNSLKCQYEMLIVINTKTHNYVNSHLSQYQQYVYPGNSNTIL